MSQTTRWDKAYAVSQLARRMSKPTDTQIQAGKRVLRYLKGEPDQKIVYWTGRFQIPSLSDASHGMADPDKMRSCSEMIIFLAGRLTSYAPILQQISAQSSTESELSALGRTAKETRYSLAYWES